MTTSGGPWTAASLPAVQASAGRPSAPRAWAIRAAEVKLLLVAGATLVGAMWLRHGGLDRLGTLAGLATGAGQLSALLGTYVALVGIVLVARVPWIDHLLGSDRLARWHRWAGFTTAVLLLAHVILDTTGWALSSGRPVLDEFLDMLSMWDLLAATVGLALMLVVAVSSMRAARRRLERETWYGLHLYAYLGIALAFVHQVSMGSDLVSDPVALGFWLALYAVAFGLLLAHRVVAPIRLWLRHRPRVAAVVPEAAGVVSIHVTGRHLEQLGVRAGQWFQVRFLRGAGWWRPHPFSISAAPNATSLRFTVKALGDDTARLLQQRLVGVGVFLEGPYGALTTTCIGRPRVVMLAGGIGVTPLRAILEDLPPAPGPPQPPA